MHMHNHLTYSYWSLKVSEQMYGLNYLSCITLNELCRQDSWSSISYPASCINITVATKFGKISPLEDIR